MFCSTNHYEIILTEILTLCWEWVFVGNIVGDACREANVTFVPVTKGQQINDGDNILISLKIIQKGLTQNKQTKKVLNVISNEKILSSK